MKFNHKITRASWVTGAVISVSTVAVAASVTLSTNSIIEGIATVGICDVDGYAVNLDAPSYDAATTTYRVAGVTSTGVNAGCVGKTLAVTLINSSGTDLGHATTTITGGSDNLTLSSTVDANAVTRVVSSIYGS